MKGRGASRAVLVGATAVSLGTALLSVRTSALPRDAVIALSLFAALLAVVALPSVGSSRAAKLTVVLGAYVMGVHGNVSTLGDNDMWMVFAWLASTVVVLVFPRIERPRRGGASSGVFAASVPLALCLFAAGSIGGVHLGGGPGGDPSSEGAGGEGDAGPNDPLRSSLSIDMTRRPRLSEKELFTVATDRPTFWRTNVFDEWNGWQWSRSGLEVAVLSSGRPVSVPLLEEPQGSTADVRQDIELLADARALPAAATVRRVEVASPTALLGGTDLASLNTVGPGTRYSVDSDVPAPSSADLDAARNLAVPREIAERYLDPGPVGGRTAGLAASFETDPTRPWAAAAEIEEWLGENTRYSIDAPTSPPGSDVVEDFLFESRLGWCEQIASSLVVLLRARGVPARLAIGYVPADRTALGDRWLVRERDAHAWAEVWVDGVGWMSVDPTSNVGAVAGGAAPDRSSPLEIAAIVALIAGVMWAIAKVAPVLWRRLRRRRTRRAARSRSAATALSTAEERLIRIGRRHGVEPSRSVSISCIGRELADRTGRPDVAEIGVALDEWRYRWGDEPAPPEEVQRIRDHLDEIETLTPV